MFISTRKRTRHAGVTNEATSPWAVARTVEGRAEVRHCQHTCVPSPYHRQDAMKLCASQILSYLSTVANGKSLLIVHKTTLQHASCQRRITSHCARTGEDSCFGRTPEACGAALPAGRCVGCRSITLCSTVRGWFCDKNVRFEPSSLRDAAPAGLWRHVRQSWRSGGACSSTCTDRCGVRYVHDRHSTARVQYAAAGHASLPSVGLVCVDQLLSQPF